MPPLVRMPGSRYDGMVIKRFSILSVLLSLAGACGGIDAHSGDSKGGSPAGDAANGAAGMAASNIGIGGTAGTAGGTTTAGAGGSSVSIVDAALADVAQVSTCLSGNTFDPREVYLAGTLEEGACYEDALAHWSCPNVAVVGFDCSFLSNSFAGALTEQIRPTDGRLIYLNIADGLIHEFNCDGCPYRAGDPYPMVSFENDPIVTAPCPVGPFMTSFLIAPSGDILFHCFDTNTWRNGAGAVLYADESNDPLLRLGYDGKALTKTRVIDLVSGQANTIVGLPSQYVYTIRAKEPNGFLLALRGPSSGTNDGRNDELWLVGNDGAASRVGTYPPAPAGVSSIGSAVALEGTSALLQFGSGSTFTEDLIIRRDVGGSSAVVYSEASKPLVKIHISGLVTGP